MALLGVVVMTPLPRVTQSAVKVKNSVANLAVLSQSFSDLLNFLT